MSNLTLGVEAALVDGALVSGDVAVRGGVVRVLRTLVAGAEVYSGDPA